MCPGPPGHVRGAAEGPGRVQDLQGQGGHDGQQESHTALQECEHVLGSAYKKSQRMNRTRHIIGYRYRDNLKACIGYRPDIRCGRITSNFFLHLQQPIFGNNTYLHLHSF